MYFHSQDLRKEERSKSLISWRCWWNLRERTKFTFAISVPSPFWHVHIDLCENGWQEEAIGFDISCPLFATWLGFENPWIYRQLEKITKRKGQKYTDGRQIGVSFHGGTFWFSLWETPMESSSSDPKWWKFNFNAMDFFFGRFKHNLEILKEGQTTIAMPEGAYAANYKIEKRTWNRPRWPFKKEHTSIDFDIPAGIPHEGKGENSWDCGMDATFGIGTEWDSNLNAATERIAMSCLKTRQRYGSLNSPEYLKWKLDRESKLLLKPEQQDSSKEV